MTSFKAYPCAFNEASRIAALLCAAVLAAPAIYAGDPNTIYLGGPTKLDARFQGSDGTVRALSSGTVATLSLAADDFDMDGVSDLAVGYSTATGGRIAIFRGNLDAFAPQSQRSFDAIGRGEFPSPYLGLVQSTTLAARPDLLSAGVFIGHDGPGLIAAARGDHSIYVLARDASGNFQIQQTLDVQGSITALAAFRINSGRYTQVFVGVHGSSGPRLQIYTGSDQGLSAAESFRLNGDAAAFDSGNLDGDGKPDVLVVAGGQLSILHAGSRSLEAVSVPFSVAAAAVGSFVSDREPFQQLALLSSTGSVHIFARGDIDSRPFSLEELRSHRQARLGHVIEPTPQERRVTWKEVESFLGVATLDAGGLTPQFLRTRISSNGPDDVMILGSGRLTVIAHPGGAAKGVVLSRAEQAYSLAAALSLRVNIDGRPGVVFVKANEAAPFAMMPLPDPTFFVNRTDDPVPGTVAATCNNASASDVSSSCSLREAVRKANGTGGADTIMVAAGTYTLSLPRQANVTYDATAGSLDVTDSVNIVGATDGGGNPTSIILGGSTSSNGVDQIFRFNPDESVFTNATISISNLVLKWGFNRGSIASAAGDGDGGAFYFDTGGTGASTATGTLTVTNCIIENNQTADGEGGGFAAFNTERGTGFITVTNSIVQNNTGKRSNPGAASLGGGIIILFPASMTMTNTQVLNNSVAITGTTYGAGGGITFLGGGGAFNASTIHGGVISGNGGSVVQGGGIYSTAGLTIDQGTVISNNTSALDGGGIWWAGHSDTGAENASLTKVTITGNAAQGTQAGGNGGVGGGIFAGNGSTATLTIHFSRLAGNTAKISGSSNLFNQVPTAAINNWWGTNSPGGTITDDSGGVTTFNPYIVLTHTASPNKIKINQSATLTADMSKDNNGSGAALTGNLGVLNGVPIAFNNAVDGSISGAQSTIQSSGMATATFNAGSAAGGGKADAVVDSATVTANIVVLAPPSIAKAFSPKLIQTTAGSGTKTSTITFSLTNPNVVAIEGDFTDTLPTGLVVASTPNPVNNCGGTFAPVAAAGSVTFSNAALAVGTCTIKVDVQSAIDNVYNNSVGLNSSDAGNSVTPGTDSLTVINPPHIAKLFGLSSLPFGSTTSLTITVSNQNQHLTLSGISFTDTLPNAAPGTLIVATPSGLTNSCSGSAAATSGGGTVSLATTSLAPGASCTVSLNVQGAAVGAANNSVSVSDAIAGTGNTATANATVIKADTASGVTSSVNPSVFGQPVTFTATVSAVAPGAGTPTGTVTFLDAGSSIGTGTLSGGVATLTTAALAVNSHTITTSYTGDGNFNGSTGSLTGNPQVVNKANTTTALTSSANPSVFGQSVTFTAAISAVAPGTGTPTGTVTFLDGGSSIGTGTLSGGVATLTTTALAVNSHTITTSYTGDGNFNGSTGSLTGNPQVVGKDNTTTAVTSSLNPSLIGQAVTFTATVSPVAPGSGAPTGTVTFLDGGSSIGTGTLSGGVAALTTSALALGNHTITTTYTGDGNFNGGTGSLTGNPQVVNKTNTTTAVTSSLNPSVFGQSVTFTATVSPATGTGTPTGTVTFLDGGSSIGMGTLNSGVATFTTSALSATSHTITASYADDANFNGSTGSLTGNPQVVSKANTTTGLTSSVNPSTIGQSVTFTATISAAAPGTGTPTGTVTFLDGGSPIGTGTLNGSGVATFTSAALALGSHTITTSYPGDGNFNGSTGSLTGNPQVVNKANTTTALSSSVNPSLFGQPVTFTAAISAVAPGTGTPTGTVTFLDAGSSIGTGTLSGGIATFTTSSLAVTNHIITTSYTGDGNFNGSTGALTGNPQVVGKANTATVLTSSLNPSLIGQPVTFTAAISPVAPGSGTATGTVTFLDGGSSIGTGTLSGGVATITTSALALGNHTITTSYTGDGNFNGSTGSLTGNPQVVTKASTTTAVSSLLNPSVFGQPVTFSATVSPVAPGTGTPTGTVTFLDGGSPIGTVTLSSGAATFTTSALVSGSHTITTSYGGDTNFNGSTGALAGPQIVGKANTASVLSSSLNPSTFGQSVTFTAIVAAVSPGAGIPTGNVTLLDGGIPIATGTLGGGLVAFTTSALLAGNHTMTTMYGGDANFNASAGSLTGNPQVVNAANVSAQVSVTQTGFVRNRATGIWSATMTVTNTSGAAIASPIQVVLTNLTSGVTMQNKNGTFAGNPYITVVSTGVLAPGASVGVSIQFTNPANGFINYTPVTYAGGLP